MIRHLTASAAVIDPRTSTVLLVWHRATGAWMLPGGHVDAGESPAEAALREVFEETGVEAVLAGRPLVLPGMDWQPSPMVTAVIPAPAKPERPGKPAESAHLHIDLLFAATADCTPRSRPRRPRWPACGGSRSATWPVWPCGPRCRRWWPWRWPRWPVTAHRGRSDEPVPVHARRAGADRCDPGVRPAGVPADHPVPPRGWSVMTTVFPPLTAVRDCDGDVWHLNPETGFWFAYVFGQDELTLDEVAAAWGPVTEIHDDTEVSR